MGPMRYAWASATDPGKVRKHNEDSVYPRDLGVDESGFIAAVADGMGGHIGGEVASGIAISTVADSDHLTPEETLHAANLAVIDGILDNPRLAGMGTTLTLASFGDQGALTVAHVGDSRAYLARDGTIEQLTTDHSMVAELVAAGEITPAQAKVHPYRSVITRAVGLERNIEVDVLDKPLEVGDRVLLCSDGLTSMLDDTNISAVLAKGDDVAATVWELVDAANAAGGEDNITVVLIDVVE